MRRFFIIAVLCFLLPRAQAADPLLCYVGGTMRPAMEEIVKAYERKTGQKILIDYSGSGELLVKMKETRKGDLYVCHDPFMAAVMKQGMGKRAWAVSSVTPVIVVSKGNPEKIKGFKDLARKGLKIILPHETFSTTGHLVTRMAEKAGLTKDLDANTVSRTKGGSEAANAVVIGTVDAAIVWDAVWFLRKDKLDMVPIEPVYQLISGVDAVTSATFGKLDMGHTKVTIATLTFSRQPEAAAKFAEFTASPEAYEIWKKQGFGPAYPAPAWIKGGKSTLKGSLFVYCAAGMRGAVEKLAKQFETESGVRMETTYDGSNKLLGQIKLTKKGDVYIAGDAEYVEMAARENLLGQRRDTLCFFVPVIMVRKGNPRGIKTLSDLLTPGLKIGQGDEKVAAVGRLLPALLKKNGIDAVSWKKNVVLSTPTVNELGMAVKLGTIDACVVWGSIADDYPNEADIVPLDPVKNIVPPVEGAILACSKNTGAAEAFLAFLASDKGRIVLMNDGYVVDRP